MELYAAGFNAWAQLLFRRDGVDDHDDEPADLRAFTCVLRNEAIRKVDPLLTYTNVDTSSGTATAGMIPKDYEELRKLQQADPGTYGIVAKASNSVLVVSDASGRLKQYASSRDMLHDRTARVTGKDPSRMSSEGNELTRRHRTFPSIGPVVQLLAYETGFVALTAQGQVFTWGDERYAACLGRDVTPGSPADEPGLVHELVGLPTGSIVKIAANGYLVAALTSGNDLYCWGGHPAQQPVLEELTGYPNPVVIGEHDVADVGVGESHLIALTADGQVFVTGDNKNGQLGLGADGATEWTRVDLGLHKTQKVTGVAAGPRNSFIVVEGCPP